MIKVDADKMRELDQRAQEEYGIPGLILMENAGLRASEVALQLLKKVNNKSVLVFCGPGNNGGDGFVLARHLLNKKIKVKVFLLAERDKIKGDALINFNILLKMGQKIEEVLSRDDLNNITQEFKKRVLIIDAIFGIGLNKDISGIFFEIINLINNSRQRVLSLDIPSGLCATTGKIFGACVKANTTVTFGVSKKGFFLRQGPRHAGILVIADISFPRRLLFSNRGRYCLKQRIDERNHS